MEIKTKLTISVRAISACLLLFIVYLSFSPSPISYGEASVLKNGSGNVPISKHDRRVDLGCNDCHETEIPQPLSADDCVSCHDSFEEVAESTANLDPNPHNSPHYGMELDCNLCHHEHSESENFCAQCHEWKLVVP